MPVCHHSNGTLDKTAGERTTQANGCPAGSHGLSIVNRGLDVWVKGGQKDGEVSRETGGKKLFESRRLSVQGIKGPGRKGDRLGTRGLLCPRPARFMTMRTREVRTFEALRFPRGFLP